MESAYSVQNCLCPHQNEHLSCLSCWVYLFGGQGDQSLVIQPNLDSDSTYHGTYYKGLLVLPLSGKIELLEEADNILIKIREGERGHTRD